MWHVTNTRSFLKNLTYVSQHQVSYKIQLAVALTVYKSGVMILEISESGFCSGFSVVFGEKSPKRHPDSFSAAPEKILNLKITL